jgi:hypothetical protein
VLEFLLALALAFYMVFFGVREINRDKVSQSTYIYQLGLATSDKKELFRG